MSHLAYPFFMPIRTGSITAEELHQELLTFIEDSSRCSESSGRAIDPGHRVPFRWPPHPISADFHVLPSDWSGEATLEADGEVFEVQIARTRFGYFGRVIGLWHEARGESLEEVLQSLRQGAEPLFQRQRLIAQTLGLPGRYTRTLQELSPVGILRLLYCPDRDVSHEASILIETHASLHLFTPSLIEILRDQRHPYRRVAQWSVLDLFEDLPSFCTLEAEQLDAISAIKGMIWDAEDDIARTIYKAGVVLGGHICTSPAASALIECVFAPSKLGRRSAIHACFHLVEWMPEFRQSVLQALERAIETDSEELLREFASGMRRDIDSGVSDHVPEPTFPEELLSK